MCKAVEEGANSLHLSVTPLGLQREIKEERWRMANTCCMAAITPLHVMGGASIDLLQLGSHVLIRIPPLRGRDSSFALGIKLMSHLSVTNLESFIWVLD